MEHCFHYYVNLVFQTCGVTAYLSEINHDRLYVALQLTSKAKQTP
jgi:hypothetical protein